MWGLGMWCPRSPHRRGRWRNVRRKNRINKVVIPLQFTGSSPVLPPQKTKGLSFFTRKDEFYKPTFYTIKHNPQKTIPHLTSWGGDTLKGRGFVNIKIKYYICNMEQEKLCKNCKYQEKGYDGKPSTCNKLIIADLWEGYSTLQDNGIGYIDENYDKELSVLFVGDNFGCIHFSPK